MELDGEVHNDAMQSARDFERDERLKVLGVNQPSPQAPAILPKNRRVGVAGPSRV